MFTGLVQHIGRVNSRVETEFGARLSVAVGFWPCVDGSIGRSNAQLGLSLPDTDPAVIPALALQLGESVAVSGCCLTLARIEGTSQNRILGFDVIHQTLRVTALGRLREGDRVNLERSVTPLTLLGGHLVQGHVDALGIVDTLLRDSGEWRVRVRLPSGLLGFVHNKGSITLDGVSLTVASLDDGTATIDVCLIPETLARTTLGDRVAGDPLNVEVDCLSKMVARLVGRAADPRDSP
jgi:riboflavin synthase